MNHEDLEVWKKAVDFTHEIYRFADTFPQTDIYDPAIPLRRAAASIPGNVQKAGDSSNRDDRSHFMHLVIVSLSEIETHLGIAKKLGYPGHYRQLRKQVAALQTMVSGLMSHDKRI